MSVLDTLNAATPNRRTVKLCLDGAVQAQWDALQSQMEAAAAADSRHASLSDPYPELTRLADEMDALRDAKVASEVRFVVEAMQWTSRVALQADHPPRRGNMLDQLRGYNTDTFAGALIRASVVSVTGADGDTVTDIPEATWHGLLGVAAVPGRDATDDEPAVPEAPAVRGSLSYQQVSELLGAADQVNDRPSRVPPSARSWLESRDTGTSSTSPGPGTSPPDASKGGSRPGSPTSSTAKPAARKKGSRSAT